MNKGMFVAKQREGHVKENYEDLQFRMQIKREVIKALITVCTFSTSILLSVAIGARGKLELLKFSCLFFSFLFKLKKILDQKWPVL